MSAASVCRSLMDSTIGDRLKRPHTERTGDRASPPLTPALFSLIISSLTHLTQDRPKSTDTCGFVGQVRQPLFQKAK